MCAVFARLGGYPPRQVARILIVSGEQRFGLRQILCSDARVFFRHILARFGWQCANANVMIRPRAQT